MKTSIQKITASFLALILLAAIFSSCQNNAIPPTHSAAPPTPIPYAPLDDNSSVRTTSGILYYPSADESRLVPTIRTEIEVMRGETVVEALLGELLRVPPEEELKPVFPAGNSAFVLDLEQSKDVVTVNLSVTGISYMPYDRLYTARAAITNTLTEARGVRYVNILFDGKELPLQMIRLADDVPLPTGCMTRVGENVSVEWLNYENESRRLANNPETGQIKRFVTLYFASPDGTMLVPEVRELTLSYQNIVQPLIEELVRGPSDPTTARRTLPSGARLFSRPELYYSGSGRVEYVDLNFSTQFEQFVNSGELSEEIIYASLIRTLATFVPQLEGIRLSINGRLITIAADILLPEGVINRSMFPGRVGQPVELYFPREDGRLRYAVHILPQEEAGETRRRIGELIRGAADQTAEDPAVIPFPNGFSTDDIKGIVFNGDTAIINLSEAGAEKLSDMDALTERAVVFSLINTVAGAPGINWVRILVEETPVETLSGSISLIEPLLKHPGLAVTAKELGK